LQDLVVCVAEDDKEGKDADAKNAGGPLLGVYLHNNQPILSTTAFASFAILRPDGSIWFQNSMRAAELL